MIRSPNDIDSLSDLEVQPIESVALNPALPTDVKSDPLVRAANLSRQAIGEMRQWQTYLEALGLDAFVAWIQERSPLLTLHDTDCTLLNPPLSQFIEAVTHLQVGAFKVCLLVTGALGDDYISVPRAVVDLPDYAAHFYVAIKVQEETEFAQLHGFLSYPQWELLQASESFIPQPNWTYEVPLDYFDLEADRLLLDLVCLDPAAIALPTVPDRSAALRALQPVWASRLNALSEPGKPLWQALTWDEGGVVLTTPNLLQDLYQIQRGEPAIPFRLGAEQPEAAQPWRNPSQAALNTGIWLQNTLDEVAQRLAWILLPPLSPTVAALRSQAATVAPSPEAELETLLNTLQQTALNIPALLVHSAYHDFQLGGADLRLFIVVWETEAIDRTPEWSLLAIAGTDTQAQLPQGLKLILQDQSSVLVERALSAEMEDAYLYGCVVGTLAETFTVSLALPNGDVKRFPPFAFSPQAGP